MKKIILRILFLASLVGLYWFLSQDGTPAIPMDDAALPELIADLGVWGPIAIVLVVASAIVWRPIPSVPIALAAGAAYDHVWGTLYILIGTELGAVVAFTIARLSGQDVVKKPLSRRPLLGFLGSQDTYKAFIFIARHLPFVSLGDVSYAAGLTPLAIRHFAIATLAGVTPASFLLAHFGGEMSSGNASRIMTTVMGLFGFTVVTVFVKLILDRRGRRTRNHGLVGTEAKPSLW